MLERIKIKFTTFLFQDLDSDRGAETYDYVLAQKVSEKERLLEKEERAKQYEEQLDNELKDYWNQTPKDEEEAPTTPPPEDEDQMETGQDPSGGSFHRRCPSNAIAAGRKRNIKDRLGSRPNKHHGAGDHNQPYR